MVLERNGNVVCVCCPHASLQFVLAICAKTRFFFLMRYKLKSYQFAAKWLTPRRYVCDIHYGSL